MNKTIVLIICLIAFSIAGWSQTLGEKYKLPEETGQLRTDGVYHLPVSLLPGTTANVEAYFRFFPDDTFIVLHSRKSPETNPEHFQANCNYQFIKTGSAPFNRDYSLKTKGNVARAKVGYNDKAVLLEMDVRTDVIKLTMRTFSPSGERMGEPVTHIMPFHQITWPVASTVINKK